MKYLQKLISREFYRSTLFWVLSLLVTYTLVGFFLVPNLIHKTLVTQVEQQLGWQAKIEKITFNPYTFTLNINQLQIADQQAQTQLSFQRYHMNFELRSIIEGAFTFADIELLEPQIRIERDKQGITNFEHALQRQQEINPPAAETEPVETSQESALPKLLFDNISLIAGKVTLVDQTPGHTVKHQLDPISFNLKNFFTYGDNQGDYHFDAGLDEEQTITWHGTLAVNPVRSSGSLKIDGFKLHDFWDYLGDQVPYTLQHAVIGLSADYQLSMLTDQPLQLSIARGMIGIDKIKLANKQQAQSFADIDAVDIGPFDFSLSDSELQIKQVSIDRIHLNVERDKQGLVNVLAPFEKTDGEDAVSPPQAAKSSTDSATESAFQWSIADINLSNSEINFTDHQPTTTADISVNKINFAIRGVDQDLSSPLPFDLAYSIDQAGATKITGQVTPTPLNLEAQVAINELALPALQPYIDDLARVKLAHGKLSVSGAVKLSNDLQGQTQGNFQGAFNIDQLNTQDKNLKQRLVGWQALAIDPITVNFNPLSIAITKVALTKPYVRLVTTKDRALNLAQLAINNEPQQDDAVQAATDKQAVQSQPVPIKIDQINIRDGGAYFADLSLQPQFATSIEDINGDINGLSSENLARADVNISGNIEEYGKMLVKGKINPLSGDLYTDINASFNKIELAPLTPYAGRHVGYAIDKGKLSLDLNYQIANNMLDAKNHLVLNQFELGQTIASDEAIDLPLKLALALFKDKNGVIDISLPITGDMASPDFAIGGLAMQAFVNLLSKAVTSPFSMVANLVGGDPDELNSVAFSLGSASLSEADKAQLNTLATVLNARPSLILEVRANVDEKLDGLALKQQKLATLLTTSGVNNTAQQTERIALVEQLLTQHGGAEQLGTLQTQMRSRLAEQEKAEQEDQQQVIDQYEQSLIASLLDKQPLENFELIQLAQQRVKNIKTQLFEQGKVDNTQVFALQPLLNGQAQENSVSTIFTLTAN